MFLISWFICISFVGARPFKKTLFHNRPLMIVLIIDIIFITAAFFFSEHLHFLQLEPIALEQATTVYLICLCTGCLNLAYVCCIRAAELYKEQFPKVENGYARLKELTHSI
jgi:protein-S-isoprenylcysteine O-methyltransferase Ste14